MKTLRHRIEYGGVKFALLLVGLLPLSIARGIGAGLGRFAFDVLRVRRRVSEENIARALGVSPAEATRIARRSYANMGRTMMEYVAFPRLSPEDVRAMVEFRGTEHFEKAFAGGKGVVLFTGHLGNWELMGARFVAEGYDTDFLVGEQSNKLVDDTMNNLRRAQGIGIIARNVALRGVLRALKDNRMVCLLGDQNVLTGGIFVDFFGRLASTAKGAAVFAMKAGCPVVVSGVRRSGRGHIVTADATLWPDASLDKDEAALDLTQRLTNALSGHIRRAPDEYFWAHRRWKTRPPEEA